VYKDVTDLLKSPEVKTFQKLKWGGGPIIFFWGFRQMTNGNKAAWEAHVLRVDKIVGRVLPLCIVISVACILSVRNLAGLGTVVIPLPGLLDS
jgi:hypothetical protein